MTEKRKGNNGRRVSLTAGACLLAAVTLLLAGCSKEPLDEPGGDGDQLTEITLAPESMGEVAMETRSLSGVDENVVEDLWVIQLNSAGTAQLQAPQYVTTVTGSGTSYTAKANIKAAASRLYFIANTHNSTLYNGATTSAAVEGITLTVSNEASLAPGNTLPMSGYLSGTPTAANLTTVKLKRAVSKVTFKLAADIKGGSSFTLTSVKVYNVPKALHPFRDPSKLDPGKTAANCYPDISVGFINQWADLSPSDKTLSAIAKECGWCYLPENGRGTGTAADQTDKTAATALGGKGTAGQGDYATYIEITGDYMSNLGDIYTDTKYRIYLGGDAVEDYNLLRNTHYIVTATIWGLNDYDSRIEIGTPTYSDSYYDYTDNLTGRFVYGKTDASNGDTMNWDSARTVCPEGWWLPTLTELEIMYCMRDTWESSSNGFVTSSSPYWSATESSSYSGNVCCMTFTIGRTDNSNKISNYRVRCVRDL